MNKNTLIFAIGFIPLILLIALVIVVLNQQNKPAENFDQNLEHLYNGSEVTLLSPTATEIDNSDENTIRRFFDYIDKDEFGLALNLLSTKLVGEDPPQLNSTLQAYGVTFSHFESVKVINLKKISEQSSFNKPVFQVDIDIKLKPITDEPIWEQGINTRFITLEKSEGSWKIESIATSI